MKPGQQVTIKENGLRGRVIECRRRPSDSGFTCLVAYNGRHWWFDEDELLLICSEINQKTA